MPNLLVALRMMNVARGIQLVYCRGDQIFSKMNIITPKSICQVLDYSQRFPFYKLRENLGISFMVILILLAVIIRHVLLNNIRPERLMYVTRGNPKTERLSGINIWLIKSIWYVCRSLNFTWRL